ncbi:Menaquinone reductase, iron-sulfur cluster-binding subunit [Myxococcaceae bacterium]|nr:Menaquinone reductase, iron-sulfur cluster-binding subunit [Myxococcaceae bacterium]
MPQFDRREFLKLVGVGAGAGVATACSDPVEYLIPYVVQPEVVTPGIPNFYASTCRECSAGCGLHVKTREGRPIKLEGNPESPINRGALCGRGQAGIGRTYHPDRFQGPMRRNEKGDLEPAEWSAALADLTAKVKSGGAGVFVLGGDPGATASVQIDAWVKAVGAGGRVVYDPFAPEALRAASRLVFDVDATPIFDLSSADLVVSFANDLLETGISPTEHSRQLAEARDVRTRRDGGARFVYVGPRGSMTAENADEWLAAKPGTEGILALALARIVVERGRGSASDRSALGSLLDGFDVDAAASATGLEADSIRRLGEALAAAKSPVALAPGVAFTSRRAAATAASVLILNQLCGAVGSAVKLPPAASEPKPAASHREVLALIDSMKSGKVQVLLVHDADPLYSLSPSTGFAEALAKVPFVVSFASLPDETTARAHLVLPDHTPMESWGDVSPRPGIRSIVQPTFRPLYQTRAMVDVLLDVGRAMGGTVAAALPEGTFQALVQAAFADTDWRKTLAMGGVFGEPPSVGPVSLSPDVAKLEIEPPLLEGEGEWTLVAYPSPLLHDGRGANLPWLQEVPDPVTKIAWQSWVEVSKATAEKIGAEVGDVIAVETPFGRIEAPCLPRGALRDDVVAVAIGQGHTVGRFASRGGKQTPGEPRGVNVIAVLPSATDEANGRAWLSTKAKLSTTGRSERIAFLQTHDNQRQRQLAEAVPVSALAAAPAVSAAPSGGHGDPHGGAHGDSHGAGHSDAGHHEMLLPFDAAKDALPSSFHRWGMAIDLDRCTGCSACVVACYIENNIPIVGEDQVLRGRVMSWIRIERFVGPGVVDFVPGRPAHVDNGKLGDTDIRHLPMVCQQCGSAPCEPVCPVIATYHNDEGLNGMIYNRCIGTRYCANNCPYKVRRFNFYDYDHENWPEPMHLGLNPDVTVRGQGVMEKCTFCVQRIALGQQTAKDQKRAIADGEVTTACAQSCPTDAIVFGNLRDETSRAVQLGNDPPREYHALHMLNTRPSVTYLAKVTRGPVEA